MNFYDTGIAGSADFSRYDQKILFLDVRSSLSPPKSRIIINCNHKFNRQRTEFTLKRVILPLYSIFNEISRIAHVSFETVSEECVLCFRRIHGSEEKNFLFRVSVDRCQW